MEEATEDKPKCLIFFAGKTLLEWQIKNLKYAGISQIGIVTGYCAKALKFENLNYFVNNEWNSTNMLCSLLCTREWLQKETCIISYSDILYPSVIISRLLADTNDIAITYDINWMQLWSKRFKDPLLDAETFHVDESGFVMEIGNKTMTPQEIQGQYMGLIKITPMGFSHITRFLTTLEPEIIRKMDMTTLLRLLIRQGIRVHAIPVCEPWLEFDNPHDIEVYTLLLKEGYLDPLFI